MPADAPDHSSAHRVGLTLALYVGVAIAGGALLWALRTGVVRDVPLSTEMAIVITWAIACVAGVVSQVIPGHLLRNYRQSLFVGTLGWLIVAAPLFGVWNAGEAGWQWIRHISGVIEHGLAAFAGASIIRLVLLLMTQAVSRRVNPSSD